MDQRFKSMVDMDSQVKKAAIPLQFVPMEGFVPSAAMENVHSTSNSFYIHPASVSSVEGIPVVPSFLTTMDARMDAGFQNRQQDFYIPQQRNASAEGLNVLNSRPTKQEGLFFSGHSNISRDDDRASNLSEDAPCARVKLLCSYGGKILPRPSDGRLRYVGGETRMVTVNRDITFSSVMVKMVEVQPQTVSIKYQLPDEDMDALVSVSSEEDLENMLEEYDKLEAGDHPRLRVFLFTAADYDTPAVADAFGDAKNSEQQYLDAINGLSEAPVRKLADVSTQSAASSMSGVAVSQGASFHEQVQQLQQLQQQTPVLVPQQLVPETVQVPQVAAVARSEQDGPMVWSSEVQGSTVYTAVGVPFQSADASRLFPNTAFHQTMSAVNVRADGTLVGGQHLLVANQNGTGYSLFTNTATGPLVPDLVQTEPRSYQAVGEKLSLQKPKERQESVLLTSDGQLNGSVVTTVSQQGLGGWDQAFASDFDVSTQENVAADTRACMSEISAWSTDIQPGDGSTLTIQLCPGVEVEPASNFQLPDSLVNFLEDSLHVASTSVESCTTEMPHSGNSSNNMPLDLLTCDDFGRASCNSTGSTLPSSAASSSSYALDNAAALAESPSKFLDNLNTGLLFPVDDGGAAEKPASPAALPTPTSAKNQLSSFAFPANDVERKEVTDQKVGDRGSQDERSQERLDEPLDTTEQKPAATHHVRFTSLPDVPDILLDSDELTANPAETEAIARSCNLQVIRHGDLEEVRELGSGTFGTVYHGKWRGTDVAVKRIKASCFFGSPSEQGRLKDDFWSEACILAKLHHPNVVAFYGVVPDSPGTTLATVTEFMVNGSLKQVLQRKDSSKVLDRRRRLMIAMDAAFGMEYLHDKRIIHFDLKGENLLVNMRDPHRPVCKVGDLGLSKIKHKTMVSGGVRGTLPWMAPELLNGKSILVSEKVDVFSFGIVMWELLTGEEPYADLHYGAIIGGIVSNGLRPAIPSYCEPEWKSLMERCWADDPGARPTFAEIANELRAMMKQLQQQAQAQGQAQAQAQAQSQQAQAQAQAQAQSQQAQARAQAQAQSQQAQAQAQSQQAQGQSHQAQGQSHQAQGQQQQAQGQRQTR